MIIFCLNRSIDVLRNGKITLLYYFHLTVASRKQKEWKQFQIKFTKNFPSNNYHMMEEYKTNGVKTRRTYSQYCSINKIIIIISFYFLVFVYFVYTIIVIVIIWVNLLFFFFFILSANVCNCNFLNQTTSYPVYQEPKNILRIINWSEIKLIFVCCLFVSKCEWVSGFWNGVKEFSFHGKKIRLKKNW